MIKRFCAAVFAWAVILAGFLLAACVVIAVLGTLLGVNTGGNPGEVQL